MKHIRKALEQAERDRAELKQHERTPTASEVVAGVTVEAAAPAVTKAADVRYQRTKVIEVPVINPAKTPARVRPFQ